MVTPSTTETGGATRLVAFVAGAAIIACVTIAAVKPIGISAPTAPLLIALAVGLVVGAYCAGIAWNGRKLLAIMMISTLLTGEGYTLLNTSERELEQREAKQAPAREAAARRAALAADIARAEGALEALTTTPRIAAAGASKAAADKAIADNAGGKTCLGKCVELLLKSKAAAQLEADAAHAELAGIRKAAEGRLQAMRDELSASPEVAAMSPLAARINVADWLLDLIRAALFSVSANGLGAFLIAFSAHGSAGRKTTAELAVPTTSSENVSSFSDTAQTSFSADNVPAARELLASENDGPDNDPQPPKGRKPRKTTTESERKVAKPDNVLLFPARHPVVAALEGAGRYVTNGELAKLMGCSDSEASKRCKEVAELLDMGWRGKHRRIGLKAWAQKAAAV